MRLQILETRHYETAVSGEPAQLSDLGSDEFESRPVSNEEAAIALAEAFADDSSAPAAPRPAAREGHQSMPSASSRRPEGSPAVIGGSRPDSGRLSHLTDDELAGAIATAGEWSRRYPLAGEPPPAPVAAASAEEAAWLAACGIAEDG
jgi:hypothetical protein